MNGSEEQYERVVEELRLLERLRRFEPMLIGTPPLGLAVPGSDIDVACSSPTHEEFLAAAADAFGGEARFATRIADWLAPHAAIVVFERSRWTIELFSQPIPTARQVGVRHFLVEQRLLALEPRLRMGVLSLKRTGIKTEAAFARSLGLDESNPYDAILHLETLEDDELRRLVAERFRNFVGSSRSL